MRRSNPGPTTKVLGQHGKNPPPPPTGAQTGGRSLGGRARHPGEGSLVVDLAAGTGQLSRQFARLAIKLVAVDPARNMAR